MNSWANKVVTGRSAEIVQPQANSRPLSRAQRIFGAQSESTSVQTVGKKAQSLDFNCNVSNHSSQIGEEKKITKGGSTFDWFLGKRDVDEFLDNENESESSILLNVGLKFLSDMRYQKRCFYKDDEGMQEGELTSTRSEWSPTIPLIEMQKIIPLQLSMQNQLANKLVQPLEKRVREVSPKSPFKLLSQSKADDGTEGRQFQQQGNAYLHSCVPSFSAFRKTEAEDLKKKSQEELPLLKGDQAGKKIAVAIDVSHHNSAGANENFRATPFDRFTLEQAPTPIFRPFKPVFFQQAPESRVSKSTKLEVEEPQNVDSEMMFIKKLKLKSANDHKKEANCSAVQSLMILLDKQGMDQSEIDCLTPYEFLLFKALAKKLYGLQKFDDASSKEFVNLVNSNISNGKQKRLEEELKIIFKKTLKHLMNVQKEKMDIESRQPLKKLNYTVGFYKYYFEQTHNTNPVFREYFKITDKDGKIDYAKLNSLLIHPLTVNATHLAMVTLSPPFKNDMMTYLDKQIIEEYREVRLSKTKRILINFYDLAAKNPSKAAIEEFTSNHQMKLPWSTRDLEHAIDTFKRALAKPPKAQVLLASQ